MVPGTGIYQLYVVYGYQGKEPTLLLEVDGVHPVHPAEINSVIDDIVSLRLSLPESGKQIEGHSCGMSDICISNAIPNRRNMVIKNRIKCPRCTLQMAGWLIHEDGYTHCVMCGYVLKDEDSLMTGLVEVVREKAANNKGIMTTKRR
jgi:ribosomal protein S27AE